MKKILAMVLAMMLVLSMSAAFAADVPTITVEKTYKLVGDDKTAISPAEEFKFTDLVCTKVEHAGVGIDKDNAPVPTIGSIKYEKGEAGKEDEMTQEVTITLPTYNEVGIYTYTFKEIDNNIAGVTYDTTDITLVVTVMRIDGKLERTAAIHTEEAGKDKTDKFENTYSAGNLGVSKTVTGSLGDLTKEFDVTVTFTAPEGDTVNEVISYTSSDNEEEDSFGTIEVSDWKDGKAKAVIKLNHNEKITFTNIPYGVTYTLVEDNYTAEGYDAVEAIDGEIKAAEKTETFTNNKDRLPGQDEPFEPDTGIALDNAPYMILMALVVIAGAALIVKRASQR